MVDYTKSFIEVQFPVSKVSKESYKERMSGASQTLTTLGKWWGRKPLILIRAIILGILLPVTDNPKKDRDIFLKILTMDDDGLNKRKYKNISVDNIYPLLTNKEKEKYFEVNDNEIKYKSNIMSEDKERLQKLAFNRLSYDDKLLYCIRPEQISNLPEKVWDEINNHLCTSANSIPMLICQLGEKKYGHIPSIGDCFVGGGSTVFEAGRMGCNIYASDLNPIATLLTWASLNLCNDVNTSTLSTFQDKLYTSLNNKFIEWSIEINEYGHRGDSYLYCSEVKCPECGYKVPLAPSWIIVKESNIIAKLIDNQKDGFDIDIITNATKKEVEDAKIATIKGNNMYCPHCKKETSIISLRNDRKDSNGTTVYGLRKWEKNEFIPRPTDLFQERLYCIRYINEGKRYYTTPTEKDIYREQLVAQLLSERFEDWQEKGILPSSIIENGDKTDEPIRTRGWQYWHQLYNPRQLLLFGLLHEIINELANTKNELVVGLLILNKLVDWGSKLSIWHSSRPDPQNTFLNQALNTIYNYGVRGLEKYEKMIKNTYCMDIQCTNNIVHTLDARNNDIVNDIWITDPPYADAVNYHELTEFFLSWDKKLLEKAFPEWYTDSKRILAVRGTGKPFNDSMIEIYKNLANHMPDNGTQVVMFTHQDVKVWAELALILWSAGLRVVSAWTIATETESGGLKSGNYVKGTVLLVLKKRLSNEVVFQDELYGEIKNEVKRQIDSMRDLDDKDDPNFSDGDYLLASYVASLKVLTSYKDIEGINVEYELSKIRDTKEESPIVEIINKAKKIANDYLIPEGIDKQFWRDFKPEERLYIKGLEIESNNIYQISAYQELSRGYGVTEYKDLFQNFSANTVRLRTASEFKGKNLGNSDFGNSLLRHIFMAIHLSVNSETTTEGRKYLRTTYDQNGEYWNRRNEMINILEFLARFETIGHMEHWHIDAYYGKLLKEAIKNDGI